MDNYFIAGVAISSILAIIIYAVLVTDGIRFYAIWCLLVFVAFMMFESCNPGNQALMIATVIVFILEWGVITAIIDSDHIGANIIYYLLVLLIFSVYALNNPIFQAA